MSRKLVAILACRNGGSRLYAKPLQNLGAMTSTCYQGLLNVQKNLRLRTF